MKLTFSTLQVQEQDMFLNRIYCCMPKTCYGNFEIMYGTGNLIITRDDNVVKFEYKDGISSLKIAKTFLIDNETPQRVGFTLKLLLHDLDEQIKIHKESMNAMNEILELKGGDNDYVLK